VASPARTTPAAGFVLLLKARTGDPAGRDTKGTEAGVIRLSAPALERRNRSERGLQKDSLFFAIRTWNSAGFEEAN
jgi:hypothetical protein